MIYGNTKERQRLLSMVRGGNGMIGDYIETVHYRTPQGKELRTGVALHLWNSSTERELYCIYTDEQTARMILAIGARSLNEDGTERGAERLRFADECPIYDFGTIRIESV